jgi:hypothetical protein
MAIRTQRMVAFANEAVVFSFDYDDVTGNVVAVRCVNQTQQQAYAGIFGSGSGPAGRSREGTFGAGTTVIAIPGGQQPRYPLAVNPDTGIAEVGGYTILARFPA